MTFSRIEWEERIKKMDDTQVEFERSKINPSASDDDAWLHQRLGEAAIDKYKEKYKDTDA